MVGNVTNDPDVFHLSPIVSAISSLGITRGCSSYKCLIQTVLLPGEKKKMWGWGERISFASLIGEKNILQKNLRRLPVNFHGQDWGICFPSVVRKAVLQGSHIFSLFSGTWALPANKGMGNACGKAANHIHLYSHAPSVPTAAVPGGHWAPKCPAESQDLSSTFGRVLTKWELGVPGEGQEPPLSLLSP